MTYREALKEAIVQLTNAGVPDADYDARELLLYVTGMTLSDWLMKASERIGDAEADRYAELVGRRAGREPLQQITGAQGFMGLSFHVTKDTLCPRPDTEILVEKAIPVCKDADVLDMCTGTGCIAISIAVLAGARSVTATDISEAALKVASDNAKRNRAEVKWILSDMFEKVEGTYDVIVSNPPYIDREQMENLMPEVKEYEPRAALFGGEDGLDFYRILTSQAKDYLRRGEGTQNGKGGFLIVEIGYDQGNAVAGMFRAAGFAEVELIRDYAGHDRVVLGHL